MAAGSRPLTPGVHVRTDDRRAVRSGAEAGRPVDQILQLQKQLGNRAVQRVLDRAGEPSVQGLFNVMPAAHVGNNAATAFVRLSAYIESLAVSDQAATRKFQPEARRIAAGLKRHQPSVATQLMASLKMIDVKDPALAVASAQTLDAWVTEANRLAALFQLDQARTAVAGDAEVDLKHHWKYEFDIGGQGPIGFNLDEWSRKTNASANSPSLGVLVKGIVDEAVTDWDPANGAIVPTLVARLLSPSAEAAGRSDVAPLLTASPLGQTYLKVLLAAKHILVIREKDIGGRTVHYQKSTKGSQTRTDLTADINWSRLLPLARAALKVKLTAGEIADETAARRLIIEAVAADPEVQKLTGPKMLVADGPTGKWSLDGKPHRVGNEVYQAQPDDRFDFDMSHAKAIVYFDWRAVYDLTR